MLAVLRELDQTINVRSNVVEKVPESKSRSRFSGVHHIMWPNLHASIWGMCGSMGSLSSLVCGSEDSPSTLETARGSG